MEWMRIFFTVTGLAFWSLVLIALLVRLCFLWPGFCVVLFAMGMVGMFWREFQQASAEAYRRGLRDGGCSGMLMTQAHICF